MNNNIFFAALLICANLLISTNLYSQCPTNLFLQSQSAIDDFGVNHPNCDSVNTLIINGQQSDDYITDLSPLSGITHVNWDFVIANNDSLQSLDALNISGPVGYLRISNNPLLENLEGLENITSTFEIKLHYNDELDNILALSNITGNNPTLDIRNNPKLTSLDGLQNLTSLADLYVQESALFNFEGLNNVQEIASSVEIFFNDSLQSFEGLNALTNVGGETFEGEFFWIVGNQNLASLSALSNLTTLNLNLEIAHSSLESLAGLENVFTFGGALRINYNLDLKSITEIENWNITNEHLSITDNYQLDSCACTPICEYLLSSRWRLIEDNGSGCNSEESILEHCPQVDNDNDGFNSTEDCDDNNAQVNPDETEVPYNGIDDDCNTETPDDDLDQDGFVLAEDCDDNNAQINPNEVEVPYNGIDDDCNTETPDDDLDQDGFVLAEDCDDTNAQINPDAVEIINNGIDENCDGMDLVSSTYELANSTITIFPNPVIDDVNIVVTGQLEYLSSLYNLDGKLLRKAKNEKTISVTSIPPGIYLLEIKDLKTGQKIIKKIIRVYAR